MYSLISPVLLVLVTATFTHVFVLTASSVAIVTSLGPTPNDNFPELFTPNPQSFAPPPFSAWTIAIFK